jgi:LPXTG-site transpeptidase (sortase) family protein
MSRQPRPVRPRSPFAEPLEIGEDGVLDLVDDLDLPTLSPVPTFLARPVPDVLPAPVPEVLPGGDGQAPPPPPPLEPTRWRSWRSSIPWDVIRPTVAILVLLVAVVFAFAGWISGASFEASQQHAFDEFSKVRALIKDGDLVDRPWPAEAPVALLRFPKLDRSLAVFPGGSRTDLRKGPAYDPVSAFPGSDGNTVIIGKSWTYGAPFGSLDRLTVGDQVILTTPAGTLAYQVATTDEMGKTDGRIYKEVRFSTLTLVTMASPTDLNTARVVTALPIAGGIDKTIKMPAIAGVDEVSFNPVLMLLFVTVLGLLVYAAQRILPLFMSRKASWAIVIPVVVALCFPTVEHLLLLLPRAT